MGAPSATFFRLVSPAQFFSPSFFSYSAHKNDRLQALYTIIATVTWKVAVF